LDKHDCNNRDNKYNDTIQEYAIEKPILDSLIGGASRYKDAIVNLITINNVLISTVILFILFIVPVSAFEINGTETFKTWDDRDIPVSEVNLFNNNTPVYVLEDSDNITFYENITGISTSFSWPKIAQFDTGFYKFIDDDNNPRTVFRISPKLTFDKSLLASKMVNHNATVAYLKFPYSLSRVKDWGDENNINIGNWWFRTGNDHISIYDEHGIYLEPENYTFKFVGDDIRLYFLKSATTKLSNNITFAMHSWEINATTSWDLTVDGGLYNVTANFTCPGTCLNILAHNVTLEGNSKVLGFANTTGSTYGLYNYGYDNVSISNISFTQANTSPLINTTRGLYFGNSVINSRITNVNTSVDGLNSYGMYFSSSSYNTINNSNPYSNANVGMYFSSSSYNTINNSNPYSNASNGMFFYSSSYNTINNSNPYSNASNGMYFESSSNNTINNSNPYSNAGVGMYVYSSSYNTINNSNPYSNAGVGMYFFISSNNNTINNSNPYSNTSKGMYFYSSSYNTINNSNPYSNTSNGMFFYSSSYNTINNSNPYSNAGVGMYFESSSNNTINNSNPYSNASNGMYFYASSYNIINNSNPYTKSISTSIADIMQRSSSRNNKFKNTTFNTSKKLQYYTANTDEFNMSQDGGQTWMVTNVSVAGVGNRTILAWNSSNISIINSLTVSANMVFDISGLYSDTNYSIWENITNTNNLTTNASGLLPVFSVPMSTAFKTVKIVKIETTPPQNASPNITSWGNNITNNQSLNISAPYGSTILFNFTSNQSLDNVTASSGITNNFSTGVNVYGWKQFISNETVFMYGTNTNGSTQNITWNINVYESPPTSPAITNITNTSVTDISAMINFTVNQSNANTSIQYGTTESFGSSTSNLTTGLNRSVTLINLLNGTKYYFRVVAWNGSNASLQTNSSIYNFTTMDNRTIDVYVDDIIETIYSDDNFSVNISITPNQVNVSGYQFNLEYNGSLLEIINVTEGTFLTQNGSSSYFGNGTDSYGLLEDVFDVIIGPSYVNSSAIAVTISFHALDAGTSLLNLSGVLISDIEGRSLNKLIHNNSIVINQYIDTDSYNISVYNHTSATTTWSNGSANKTYSIANATPHSNYTISIWSYNLTYNVLSDTPLTDTYQVPNNEPILEAIGIKYGTVGSYLNFTLNASDNDTDPLVYAQNGSGSINQTTRLYSWLPDTAGNYSVNFSVDDGYPGGLDSEIVTLSINETPTLPNITFWENNYTNNQSFDISIPIGTTVLFNMTLNQTITDINTVTPGTFTNWIDDYYAKAWKTFTENGTIIVNVSSVNGTSQDMQWNITTYIAPTPPSISNISTGTIGDTWGIVNFSVNQSDARTWVSWSSESAGASLFDYDGITDQGPYGYDVSINVTGLQTGTKYWFNIFAQNYTDAQVGSFSYAEEQNFTTTIPPSITNANKQYIVWID
jgi:parallel beta-helix repeat protein